MCRYHHPSMPGASRMYQETNTNEGPGGYKCPCCRTFTKEESHRRFRRKIKVKDREEAKVVDNE